MPKKLGALALPWEVAAPDEVPEETNTADASPSDGSWDMLPGSDNEEDPRFDRHGFRRDASKLDREEAFEAAYASRLEQQEQRWGRHTGTHTDEILRAAIPVDELKRLARLGIPARRRQSLWPQLARADDLRGSHPAGYFASLLALPSSVPGELGFAAERQIVRSLARSLTQSRTGRALVCACASRL